MALIKKLVLKRIYLPSYTFGTLYIDGEYFGYTLEPPWQNNKKNVSCIPSGTYKIIPAKHKNYVAYEVLDVSERKHIKIHIGNWISDTTGCILLGFKADL